jgi:chromate transporter
MTLRTLALRFLRIGALGFGGPMALVAMMQEQLVQRHKEVSQDDFSTGLALGQVLPGPISVDCATYIGYRLRGFWGACVTTVGLLLPAFVLMMILTPMYLHYGTIPAIGGFFKGVAPAIIAVIFMAGLNLAKRFRFNVTSAAIAVLAGIGVLMKVSPVLLIVLAGVAGMALRGESKGRAHVD